ncbi:MAG TPA: hypothetical protein PL060_06470, partial [bacterium]|nr:hypothetical protein [bacterium]
MKKLIFSGIVLVFGGLTLLQAETLFDFENDIQNWNSMYPQQTLKISKNFVSSGMNSLAVDVSGMKESWIRVDADFDLTHSDVLS